MSESGLLGAIPIHLLAAEDFEVFRRLLRERAGIALGDGKRDLVQSRLRCRVEAHGLPGFAEYRRTLEALPDGDAEWERFLNCLTTNKTDWFREPAHFEFLERELIPRWLGLGRPALRVWCAASSTGEEPYTLAMVIGRALAGTGREFRILASDLDTEVLARARNGVYPRARVEEQVPAEHRSAFAPGRGEISAWAKVRSRVRERVTFARVNLAALPEPFPLPDGEPFDLIFCRNVFIYFRPETIGEIARGMERLSAPHASLVIGHSETLQHVRSGWKMQRPSIFSLRAPCRRS